MRHLPDFEQTKIEAHHIQDVSLEITAEDLVEHFKLVRIDWLKVNSKELNSKHSQVNYCPCQQGDSFGGAEGEGDEGREEAKNPTLNIFQIQ
jgi:hypothetical protein